MKKVLLILSLSLLLPSIAVLPHPVQGAEPAIEELVRKGESTSKAPPAFALPQTPTNAPMMPRNEQLRAPAPEKTKPIPDDGQFQQERDKARAKDAPKDGAKGEAKAPAVAEGKSPLEKLITSDETLEAGKVMGQNPAKDLSQFGYSYFKNTSFAPLTDVPVSAEYLTGPGDTLVLNIWGSVEGSYELTVSRSGEVLLPRVGPAKVAGVPFGKLPEVFRQKLAKEFRDFRVSVEMGKIRTIKVYVVGEVAAPGDYSVSSLSTLLNALSAAGGPSKNGSLRDIRIRRAGGGEQKVDLYDFFTRGDKSTDIRLSSGDTIFVPVVGRVAAISGDVKRPAIYELKDEKTLADLLALAEGISATGYLQRVQISRTVPNRKKELLDFNLDSSSGGKTLEQLARAVPIQDLDIVRIYPINTLLRDHFKVEGHVDRPGFFALKPGTRLSAVITRGALLPEYYPGFLEITRLVPPELVPQKMVVDLESVLSADPAHDLEIREYDVIRVFSRDELQRPDKVRVAGEVMKPGEYRLFKKMTVRDLLIQAGYPTPSAFLGSAEISRLKRSSSKVTAFPVSVDLSKALAGDPQANLELQPFDILTVRKMPNWAEETERYVTLSGEVRFPGTYPIYKGERLSSVIERAGGFTEYAYYPGIKLTRESLREIQQKRMDESLAKAEEEVTKRQADLAAAAVSKEESEAAKTALEGLQRNIDLLRNKRAEGRLLIKFSSLEDLKKGAFDLEVKGGDALIVPGDPKAVSVVGQVYNATSVVFEPGRNAGHYLDRVGGPNDEADKSEMYIVRMDGTVISKKQSSFFSSFNRREIISGDTIVVPQRYEKSAWLKDIKDIANIIGQIAITAGVVVAAGL